MPNMHIASSWLDNGTIPWITKDNLRLSGSVGINTQSFLKSKAAWILSIIAFGRADPPAGRAFMDDG